MAATICVIGAGAVGLSTALQIAETYPTADITVYADKFGIETTSYGAAGILHPETIGFSKDVSRLHRWFGASFQRYSDLVFSQEAYSAGISFLPFICYLNKSPDEIAFMRRYVHNLQSMETHTIKRLGLKASSAVRCDTVIVEPRYYLKFLQQKLEEHGVKIERRHITSVEGLSRECDVIVNCSGLQSRKLFKDEEIVPARGQLMRVHAPWIKHAYMGKNHDYIIPARESVILGGTFDLNDETLTIREHETKEILKKSIDLVPSLQNAKIIEEWAGLRPYREELRLEIDTEFFRVPVVHNYGHGYKGIALSHGTAVEAASLVKKVLQSSKL